MTALGFLVFGITKHRPGPNGVVFALAERLPPAAGGMAVYPFAMLSAPVIRRERNNPNLDKWLMESWLEEYYHAVHQQRPAGALFYLQYGIEWLLDSAKGRKPYADSSLEIEAKAWVAAVMRGEIRAPDWLGEVVAWSKN